MREIIVQGWRFVPHSFSIVNAFQCLAFLRRNDVSIAHQDAPYFGNTWAPISGLWDNDDEEKLRHLHQIPMDEKSPMIRISFPFPLDPSPSKKILVMAIANFGVLPLRETVGVKNFREIPDRLFFFVPSHWSREGLLRSGIAKERIFVVPHGIDPKIYRPIDAEERTRLRRSFGWEGQLILLHIGTMTHNKGIDLILKSFAQITEKFPEARLILKGLNDIYRSDDFLQRSMRELSTAEQNLILPRLGYIGNSLNFRQMATLYQAADAYVSPYRAEGFNLPVLEAIACGLPVVCTAGGPTDDFTTPDFSLRVESVLEDFAYEEMTATRCLPRLEHLVHQLERVLTDRAFREKAAVQGPKFTARWTWDDTVEKLIKILSE